MTTFSMVYVSEYDYAQWVSSRVHYTFNLTRKQYLIWVLQSFHILSSSLLWNLVLPSTHPSSQNLSDDLMDAYWIFPRIYALKSRQPFRTPFFALYSINNYVKTPKTGKEIRQCVKLVKHTELQFMVSIRKAYGHSRPNKAWSMYITSAKPGFLCP